MLAKEVKFSRGFQRVHFKIHFLLRFFLEKHDLLDKFINIMKLERQDTFDEFEFSEYTEAFIFNGQEGIDWPKYNEMWVDFMADCKSSVDG